MMAQKGLRAFVCATLLSMLVGCQSPGSKAGPTTKKSRRPATTTKPYVRPIDPKSLYSRLGGEKAIRLIVDDFVNRIAADPKVNFSRKGTPDEFRPTAESVERFKTRLTEYLMGRTGGPGEYRGRELFDAHRGMKVSGAEFDARIVDLKISLKELNVSRREADELVKVIAAARSTIVQP